MKKRISILLVMTLAFSAFGSITTMAATKDAASTYSTIATKTVTDAAGNKYYVEGSCSGAGTSGKATTYFKIKLYKNGTYSADDLRKTISAKGSFSFGNGAAYSGAKKSTTVTGKTYTLTASYSGFAYNVKYSAGQHTFSCNGASYTGASSNP